MVLKLGRFGSGSEIPGNFEMWCWRRMEKISWIGHVRNEEVLESMSREISYIKYENGRLTRFVTSYAETSF
jgi:hypothetical protein